MNDLILKFEMKINEIKQDNISKDLKSECISGESSNKEIKNTVQPTDNIRDIMIPSIITRLEQKIDD